MSDGAEGEKHDERWKLLYRYLTISIIECKLNELKPTPSVVERFEPLLADVQSTDVSERDSSHRKHLTENFLSV